MRKHGWQLPYHPLQVVAIAVFLALGVAFYVFFAPFLGRKKLEYWAIGLYTPLISCVFFVYVWCAATDPGDEGIFRSKKYLNVTPGELHTASKGSRRGNGSISSVNEENAAAFEEKWRGPCSCLFSLCHPRGRFSEQQTSEDGSFFCSLCEVEVYKYSKHCRICDKCVDGFDHHCRWLNNCIGRKNYLGFFILMVSALLLLILQWSVGVFILIRCLLKKSEFTGDIKSKLGSSFSFPAFLLVVGSSSFLAMVATLPLAQLFFFHVLLVKKGISTYDYIVALREQEQQGVRSLQSPTMSPVSSITGLSSTSSFTHFRRGAWCTPPRLFLEDHQFDVALPESGGSFRSVAEGGKNPAAVKINPWKLARMNGDEVAKAAAEARKRSRVLRPAAKREIAAGTMEMDSSFGSSSGRMLPVVESLRAAMSKKAPARGSAAAPLQVAARDVFTGASGTARYPESSSPDSPPSFRPPGVFSGAGHSRKGVVLQPHQRRSSSGSDGYEASGGEDSDRIPAAAVYRLPVWNNLCEPSGADTSGELVRAPRPQNRGRS